MIIKPIKATCPKCGTICITSSSPSMISSGQDEFDCTEFEEESIFDYLKNDKNFVYSGSGDGTVKIWKKSDFLI